MEAYEPVRVSSSPFPARSLLSTMCTRHVIATSETVEVGCLITELAGINPSTRIFMWNAYLFPVRCHDSHFVHEDICRRCKTRCAANLILYRSYTDCHGGYVGGWSRARFGGKLDSENFDVISRFRENPLDRSSTELQIALSSRSLFCRGFYLKRTN